MFTHIHVHTNIGSYFDSIVDIKKLVARAKELGQTALAITDHGSITGWYTFSKECKEQGIKPIFGIEAYEASTFDGRERGKKYLGGDNLHSLMLAKDEQGILALRELQIYARKKENFFKSKGRYDLSWLKKNKKKFKGHVIWTNACFGGRVGQLLKLQEYDKAKEYVEFMKDIFGDENVYIEYQNHKMLFPERRIINLGLQQLMEDCNLPGVFGADVHYLLKEEKELRTLAVSLFYAKKGQLDTFNDILTAEKNTINYGWLLSEEEALDLAPNFEYIDNTNKIVDSIKEMYVHEIPKDFQFPELSENAPKELAQLVENSISLRPDLYTYSEELIRDRIKTELLVITKLQASDYFLMVADLCKYAKDKNILMGPNRGSAGGSLVNYILGITETNPLKYGLVFERFLNPNRVTMADIDLDFPNEYQKEIMSYIINKYGEEKTALILTRSQQGIKSILNKYKKLANSEDEYRKISQARNLIDSEKVNTLAELYKKNKKFKVLVDKDSSFSNLVVMLDRMVGLYTHSGRHAGGVLISNKPIKNYSSYGYSETDHMNVVDMTMIEVEEQKLVKMDILAIALLDKISNTAKRVGVNPINFYNDLTDPAIYHYMANNTHLLDYCFQLSSPGMQDTIKKVGPQNINELSDVIALYRPGAMDEIPDYCDYKHGIRPIVYDHPRFDTILGETHNILIYQEQALKILREFAGKSYAEADVIRRAISKKKESILNAMKEEIIAGFIRMGFTRELGENWFAKILRFKDYGFNKSHSIGYAILVYVTVGLMYYYPAYYMASVLDNYYTSSGSQDNINKAIMFIKKHPTIYISSLPDINLSDMTTKVLKDNSGLIIGLAQIKGFGDNLKPILEERSKNGLFKNINDFIMRTNINKNTFLKLLKLGVLRSLIQETDTYLELSELDVAKIKKQDSNQISLFELLEDIKPLNSSKNYFAGLSDIAIMELYNEQIENMGVGDDRILLRILQSFQLSQETDLSNLKDGDPVVFIAKIESHTVKTTAKGSEYGVFYFKSLQGYEKFGMYFSSWGEDLPLEISSGNLAGYMRVIRGKYNLAYNNIQVKSISS